MKVRNSSLSKVVPCISVLLLSCSSFAQNYQNPQQRAQEQQDALLNGNPPVQPAELSEFHVPLSPYPGASSDFIGQYEKFSAYLAAGDTAGAATWLQQMQAKRDINQYEATYLSLARYRLAENQGLPMEQMRYLLQMFETAESAQEVVVLPDELEILARRALLKLQVQNNYLSEAMATYDLLQKSGDEEVVAAFDSAMAQIHELAGNDVAYPVAARLDDTGTWRIALHKRQFYIDEVEGNVAEAELDCEGKSQTITLEVLFGYNVPAALGNCTVIFTGEPGSHFVLMQYRD